MPGLRLSPTIGYGFNGAMPFQAWIPGLQRIELHWNRLLQWVHALSDMDIARNRGDSDCLVTLQWGHALSGMDM